MTLCSLDKSNFNRKRIWTGGLTIVGVTNLPAISAGRFTRFGSALRKQRCLVSPPLRLELQCEGRHPQRAGIALPHAEGEELSGATSDRETFAFISGPTAFVGGVPLMRARNPWAMPEAST